jgi:acyl-CoA reductase-like NAD-dependent aldehyde dehydrogenase
MTDNNMQSIFPKTILIGTEWRATGANGVLKHINPATGETLGEFANGGHKDIDDAVTAAREAFPAWRKILANERRAILTRFADLIESNQDELNRIATLESGHPISFGGAMNAVEQFRYYAGWVDKLEGQVIPVWPENAFNYVSHEPFGVIGAIITWNGPIINASMKLAPALAAGNCVVLKSPELGPFGPARLAALALEAGVPPGVFNVVSGGPEAGDAVARHPGIGKISFTGGVSIAQKVLAAASENIVPVVLELGGKSANIVFEDADLDKAAIMGAHMSTVAAAGQGCLFPTRMLVHDSVYEAMVERVKAYVDKISIGDPMDPATVMGPVISEGACSRIMGYIEDTQNTKAGRLVTGGERIGGDLSKGYFIPPTIFADVDNNSRIAQEEVFGPVLSIIRFSKEEEAVRMANDTKFGLAGYLHTKDLKRAHRVAADLEAGYIGVNGFPPLPVTAPFGGWKQSGFGSEGGRAGIDEFLRTKNVYLTLE